MGYFDELAEGSFKKDANGDTLFYPWGVAGKGYIVEPERVHKRIRNFINIFLMTMIPIGIVGFVVWLLYGVYLSIMILIALGIPYIGWYIVVIRMMTSGLAYAGESLTVSESYSNSAKSHSLARLIWLIAGNLIFVVVGFWMLSRGEFVMGSLGVAFFGGCALVVAYMIMVKIGEK